MRLFYLIVALATVASANQFPLGYSSAILRENGLKEPFDKSFDELAKKSMNDFKVPGLSIAVIQGETTFSKVRDIHHLRKKYLIK
jgi:hypothetical protein